MTEQDVDDVAFLTGTNHKASAPLSHSICQSSPLIHNPRDLAGGIGNESNSGANKKSLYESHGIAACSHKKALCVATIVFALLFTIAIIIAFTGSQSDCTCASGKSLILDEAHNVNKTFIPRASNGQIFPWNNIRLPPFVKPFRYNLTIHPNLTTLEVKSQVSIEFHVDKETNFIVLHSKNLTILDKLIQDKRGNNLTIMKVLDYPGADQLYIEIKEKFKKRANYTLRIRYNFKLRKNKKGFYITTYTNKDGFQKSLAATNFEPTYARTAFPCFDEPQFKARFRITIFRDRFHITLFNTPITNTDDLGFYMGTGLLRDDFVESKEMSTYLVAFVICDYPQIVSKTTESGVPVSIYSSDRYKAQAKVVLDISVHILNYFENFFGMHYPLQKLDLVALPNFEGGAMKNWGLLTFRETAIVNSSNEISITAHQKFASILAHNLAYQWFGNLVTMKWWSDLWLNEAFVTLLGYYGVDDYYPEWKMMDQFLIDKIQPALALDALKSSHPISATVIDPSDIETIFDTMSLNKGTAILHMAVNFLELETVQSSLNDFFNTYKYMNAETKDLWNTITKNINRTLDIRTIIDTWTHQMGFPLVRLKREGSEVVATQSRFLLTSEPDQSERNLTISLTTTTTHKPFHHQKDYKWYIPLTYYTNNDSEVKSVWLNITETRFELSPEITWMKANIKQGGFYRVMYDNETWENLIQTLKNNHSIFSAADRANLIDDAFSLCRAGILNASVALDLSTYLINEKEYVPWASAIGHFRAWTYRLSESLAYKSLLKYFRQLLTPITKYLSWRKTKTHIERLLEAKVMSAAILCDLNDTIAASRNSFKEWMMKNKSIDPNLKEIVYSSGIKYGGINEWTFCWNFCKNVTNAGERNMLLKALGTASDPWLLQRYLMETINKGVFQPEEVTLVLEVVSANPEGRLLAWRHLKAYWLKLYSLYGNKTAFMGNLISAVTAHLTTPYDYYEVSTYFSGMDVGLSTRTLDQSLEIIKLNINWIKQNEEEVNTWLRKNIK
ncbi:unnamed protein product [Acanthoscelides obtectus]|uniref:Aminopeptidase n=1 Tax=Acanthoscelides obtectus TaxID=200917 RepID=A0A9P0K1Y5_ACAOB|nr:unnamed protein product [Acanthoscelides obtectus]CAK1629034.1 Endoplasmic reticulum aminopeptidase 2 [Acanthoscelides obtectus]